jgi:hypothetical protein
VAQHFVDLLHKLVVFSISLDRIQTHSDSTSFGLNVANLRSIRELRLAKTTGEVWWWNTLQEGIALLSNVLLVNVSAMNLCTWFGTKSYRVVRCQRDGWNIEHTGIILSCVHGFRAVNCIGAPEYCNRKLVSLNSIDEE